VILCDVGPRDGLQNEPDVLPPSVRAELVNMLAAAGLPRVEAVSFVRDDRVPQMAGAEEVVDALEWRDGTAYAGLVLNEQGYDRLRATRLDRVNVTLAATDSFSQRNANATAADAAARVERILDAADRPATVTISVAFGCPFEGRVDPDVVVALAERFRRADEVVLADTIGVGTPKQVRGLTERVVALGGTVGGHFHNTRNTGYANAVAALDAGATVLDASIGGLGGCPFAPRATGNIPMEDLLYMLNRMGVETTVDLKQVIANAQWVEERLGKPLPAMLGKAGIFPDVARGVVTPQAA